MRFEIRPRFSLVKIGRRPRSAWSVLLLLGGLCGCLSALSTVVLGVPASWQSYRQTVGLPQPSSAELAGLAPGMRALVAAQIDPRAAAGPHGLALFYVESRRTGTAQPASEAEGTPFASATSSWQVEVPPPRTVDLLLGDGETLSVQVAPDASFYNAEQIRGDAAAEGGLERRTVGYLPGQTLALEGTWEGGGRFTARALYAGTRDDYLAFLSQRPGALLLSGAACGGVSVVLLAVGLVLGVLKV